MRGPDLPCTITHMFRAFITRTVDHSNPLPVVYHRLFLLGPIKRRNDHGPMFAHVQFLNVSLHTTLAIPTSSSRWASKFVRISDTDQRAELERFLNGRVGSWMDLNGFSATPIMTKVQYEKNTDRTTSRKKQLCKYRCTSVSFKVSCLNVGH